MKPPAKHGAHVVAPVLLALLVAPGYASAQDTCTYDPASHTVTIQGKTPEIEYADHDLRVTDDQIMYQRKPCSGATVTNTDTINIYGVPEDEFFDIHLPFAPGFSPEADGLSEIEITIDFVGGFDYVTLYGTNQAEAVVVGAEGYNLNGDNDRDVIAPYATADFFNLDVVAGGGGDFVSSRGGRGTGGPIATRNYLDLRLYGEGGPDRMLDGDYKVLLIGGPGRDRLNGGGGNDYLDGAEGRDSLVGGPGRDRCFATPGKDRTKSCERILEPT